MIWPVVASASLKGRDRLWDGRRVKGHGRTDKWWRIDILDARLMRGGWQCREGRSLQMSNIFSTSGQLWDAMRDQDKKRQERWSICGPISPFLSFPSFIFLNC